MAIRQPSKDSKLLRHLGRQPHSSIIFTPLLTPLLLAGAFFLLSFFILSCGKGESDTAEGDSIEKEEALDALSDGEDQDSFFSENGGQVFIPSDGDALGADNPISILFLGDSLTEGFSLQRQYSYPFVVGKQLAKEGIANTIFNAGISGDTSSGGLLRLQWQLENNKKAQFDIVVIALGSNDGLRGLKVENLKKNLQEIISLAKKQGAKVLLAGMQIPLNYGQRYVDSFKKTYVELAEENDLALVPFLLEGVAGNPRFNIEDGIHPNGQGYEIVANNVLVKLKPLAKQVAENK